MTKEFEDVIRFNKEVIGLKPTETLNQERLSWFTNVINEELTEFTAANKKYVEALEAAEKTGVPIEEDHVYEMKADMIDAILDLIYFAYGRLFEIGTSVEDFECMWDAIQNANMAKKRGNKGRGSNDDAIKPEGWKSPESVYIQYMINKDKERQLDKPSQTYISNIFVDDISKPDCQKSSNNDKPELHIYSGEAKAALDSILESKMTPIQKKIWNHIKGATINHGAETGRIPTKPEGVKYDDNKPNLSLVFGGFAKALKDVGYVGTFGAKKYSPNGWKYVLGLQERYMSALERHALDILDGKVYDEETGRLSIAHVAWNALAILQDSLSKMDYDSYNKAAIAQSNATLEKYFKAKKEQNNE